MYVTHFLLISKAIDKNALLPVSEESGHNLLNKTMQLSAVILIFPASF
jgi:hypothetical protein